MKLGGKIIQPCGTAKYDKMPLLMSGWMLCYAIPIDLHSSEKRQIHQVNSNGVPQFKNILLVVQIQEGT